MRSYPSRGTPLHRWNTPCVWKYAHVGLITTYSRSSKSWRPTIIVPENRAGFFKTLAGFFLPGTLKTSPAVSMSYWSFFWEESSGIGRFCRLEIHTDGQLARFRFFYRKAKDSWWFSDEFSDKFASFVPDLRLTIFVPKDKIGVFNTLASFFSGGR